MVKKNVSMRQNANGNVSWTFCYVSTRWSWLQCTSAVDIADNMPFHDCRQRIWRSISADYLIWKQCQNTTTVKNQKIFAEFLRSAQFKHIHCIMYLNSTRENWVQNEFIHITTSLLGSAICTLVNVFESAPTYMFIVFKKWSLWYNGHTSHRHTLTRSAMRCQQSAAAKSNTIQNEQMFHILYINTYYSCYIAVFYDSHIICCVFSVVLLTSSSLRSSPSASPPGQ